MSFRKIIIQKLDELGLSGLNSRPFDGRFYTLESGTKRLVIVGFNGSDADLEWTNKSAIEFDSRNPNESNIEKGIGGAWLSTTLPKRLLSLPNDLGFKFDETVYTNAILLCSKDAYAVKQKAKEVGFSSLKELVASSLDFFQEITIGVQPPELIVCYSNSLVDLSASSVIYERFGVTQITTINESNYYKTYSFTVEINGNRIPVVCIRHLSRFKPCLESIYSGWELEKRQCTKTI